MIAISDWLNCFNFPFFYRPNVFFFTYIFSLFSYSFLFHPFFPFPFCFRILWPSFLLPFSKMLRYLCLSVFLQHCLLLLLCWLICPCLLFPLFLLSFFFIYLTIFFLVIFLKTFYSLSLFLFHLLKNVPSFFTIQFSLSTLPKTRLLFYSIQSYSPNNIF